MAMEVMSPRVTSRLRGILSTQLGVEMEDIITDVDILEDWGVDSLELLDLVMAIEASFEILIRDEDVPGLRTFGQIAEYVAARSSD